MTATGRGAARCLAAAALFGASAPAASRLAGTVPSLSLAGLLYLGAALAVVPRVVRRPPRRDAFRRDARDLAVAVVAGGAIGPVLLVAGLARTSAATASILLNAELAATVVLAALVFREHLGRRVIASAVLLSAAGVVLTWSPDGTIDVGALLVIGACVAWGVDNGVTARIDQLGPEHVVAVKGLVAGGVNFVVGLVISGLGEGTGAVDIGEALLIGAGGYGLSITLWVKGARDLGAARSQVIFATAPFVGVAIAWTALGESATAAQLVAIGLAVVAVGLSLRSAHDHAHNHDEVEHDHEHDHRDGHHEHVHLDHAGRAFDVRSRHSHRHRHEPVEHAHPHVPDLHHRHSH